MGEAEEYHRPQQVQVRSQAPGYGLAGLAIAYGRKDMKTGVSSSVPTLAVIEVVISTAKGSREDTVDIEHLA